MLENSIRSALGFLDFLAPQHLAESEERASRVLNLSLSFGGRQSISYIYTSASNFFPFRKWFFQKLLGTCIILFTATLVCSQLQPLLSVFRVMKTLSWTQVNSLFPVMSLNTSNKSPAFRSYSCTTKKIPERSSSVPTQASAYSISFGLATGW